MLEVLKGTETLVASVDSIAVIKDGKIVPSDELKCIYQGKTISIWQGIKNYYIAFNANGGTGSMNQQTMPVGVATALTANAFSRLGYLFANWAKSASGSAAYSDKQSVKDIAAAGETITLYALWTAITWYVVYDANGGSGSMANSEHKYDTTKALTANAFAKTGYLFAGWDDDTSGNVVYADKASVKNLASTHGAEVILYAVWTAITWYIKYNGNGATSGSMADSTHKYDTAKALTANAFSKTGCSFVGWATSAGGAKAYDDKQSVKNLKSTHGAVLNLYALWKYDWLVVYTATHSGGSNTSVTGLSVSVNDTSYVTVSPQTWDVENLTASGGGTVTIKNASAFSRAVIEYDVRKWANYGYNGDLSVNGTNLSDISDYYNWYSKSTEATITNGAATMTWMADVSAWDSDWEDAGISAGVHIVITKVTLYA